MYKTLHAEQAHGRNSIRGTAFYQHRALGDEDVNEGQRSQAGLRGGLAARRDQGGGGHNVGAGRHSPVSRALVLWVGAFRGHSKPGWSKSYFTSSHPKLLWN